MAIDPTKAGAGGVTSTSPAGTAQTSMPQAKPHAHKSTVHAHRTGFEASRKPAVAGVAHGHSPTLSVTPGVSTLPPMPPTQLPVSQLPKPAPVASPAATPENKPPDGTPEQPPPKTPNSP